MLNAFISFASNEVRTFEKYSYSRTVFLCSKFWRPILSFMNPCYAAGSYYIRNQRCIFVGRGMDCLFFRRQWTHVTLVRSGISIVCRLGGKGRISDVYVTEVICGSFVYYYHRIGRLGLATTDSIEEKLAHAHAIPIHRLT